MIAQIKIIKAFWALCLPHVAIIPLLAADQPATDWLIVTNAVDDDLQLSVWHDGEGRKHSVDNEIVFSVFGRTNDYTRIFLPMNTEFLCQIDLFDNDGAP